MFGGQRSLKTCQHRLRRRRLRPLQPQPQIQIATDQGPRRRGLPVYDFERRLLQPHFRKQRRRLAELRQRPQRGHIPAAIRLARGVHGQTTQHDLGHVQFAVQQLLQTRTALQRDFRQVNQRYAPSSRGTGRLLQRNPLQANALAPVKPRPAHVNSQLRIMTRQTTLDQRPDLFVHSPQIGPAHQQRSNQQAECDPRQQRPAEFEQTCDEVHRPGS